MKGNNATYTIDNGNSTTVVNYDEKASAIFWGASFTSDVLVPVKQRRTFSSSTKKRQRRRR